jgi:hypothetical protein
MKDFSFSIHNPAFLGFLPKNPLCGPIYDVVPLGWA